MNNEQFNSMIEVQKEILNTLKQIQKNQYDMMYLISRTSRSSGTMVLHIVIIVMIMLVQVILEV